MWTAAGFEVGTAACALAATTVISLATLFVLPVMTLAFALIGAPTPRSLVWVALGGAVAFVVLFGVGVVLLLTNPTVAVGRPTDRAGRAASAPRRDSVRHRAGARSPARGTRRPVATGARFIRRDLGLRLPVARRRAGGAPHEPTAECRPARVHRREDPRHGPAHARRPRDPRSGLTGMLTLAGIPAQQALLATLAYRIVSYWLSLPAGLVAWWMFRRRFPAVGQAVR